MNEMYKTPESDLGAEEMSNDRPHIMWRVYFWINVVFAPLVLLVIVMTPDISMLDYIDLTVFSFSLLGLYSYSYTKYIVSKTLWKVFFLMYPAWFMFFEVIGPLTIEMTHYGEPAVVDGYLLISLMFVIPTTYVLYMIGFKSKPRVSVNK